MPALFWTDDWRREAEPARLRTRESALIDLDLLQPVLQRLSDQQRQEAQRCADRMLDALEDQRLALVQLRELISTADL